MNRSMEDHNTIVNLEDALKASQAEVARLRAGLTYIAKQTSSTTWNFQQKRSVNNHGHAWEHWIKIAERVLDGKEPSE